MNLNIKGKVFNLPLDIDIYYEKEVNVTYFKFQDMAEWNKFHENILQTLRIENLNNVGLRYTYMAFFLDGTTFPEGIFIN